MFAHFKRLHDEDPREFHNRYYWRSLAGPSAQKAFPVLLDAYARAHRLALLGEMPSNEKEPWIDKLQDVVMLRIFGRRPASSGSKVLGEDVLAEIAPELFAPPFGANPVWITLFEYSWYRFWSKWRIRPVCQIALDPRTIVRLIGCVENFFVATHTLAIWFGQKRVRVFSFPLIEQDLDGAAS